jgi:hypothetical protein
MLIMDAVDESREGEWFERELWGQTIGLKIRPRTEAIVQKIRDKFKNLREGKNKEETILETIQDYILEDFRGLGTANGEGGADPLPLTLENKKKVLYMPVPVGEDSNLVWVVNKANELGFQVIEDEIKN